jgi:NAD+ synthase
MAMTWSTEALSLDYEREAERIEAAIVRGAARLKRRGAVVAVSGGIDSGVCAALAVRALGRERVFCLMLPESESSDETRALGRLLVDHLGVAFAEEDVTAALAAVGCYRRRDEAIRAVIPEYGPGWKCKIVLPGVVDSDTLRIFSVVAWAPDGREIRKRLSPEAYLGVVAATNFKQRVRKMLEYYHADRLNYAVIGTPNLLEYDQGFFVRNGDGAADIKPIAHLYKTQVYELAAHLGVPEEIRRRPPTTDTYSLSQSQEEFFFSLPFAKLDLCLWARDHEIPPAEVEHALGFEPGQAERVFRDIDSKRRVARILGAEPLRVDDLLAGHA